MQQKVREIAGLIEKRLADGAKEDTVQLKLNLRISNSMLYLALGTLLYKGSIELSLTDLGYQVRKAAAPRQAPPELPSSLNSAKGPAHPGPRRSAQGAAAPLAPPGPRSSAQGAAAPASAGDAQIPADGIQI
ncbi:MAG: hypothetical protein HY611_02490 [Elusimicrobia bacterium]|nr:hypothetical protein [Elusimicrobiota bacterium]